jgi:hypothetical protein
MYLRGSDNPKSDYELLRAQQIMYARSEGKEIVCPSCTQDEPTQEHHVFMYCSKCYWE